MVRLASFFVLASVFSASFSFPLDKRDAPTILADIAEVGNATNNLNTAVTNLPAQPNLFQAFALKQASDALLKDLKQGTTDVTSSGPISDADSTTIQNNVLALEPDTIKGLSNMVSKKPALDTLPKVSDLVLQSLKDLQNATDAFASALITKAPDALKKAAQDSKGRVDDAFTKAITAFSSKP